MPAKTRKHEIRIARKAFAFGYRTFREGDIVLASDPAVERFPDHFYSPDEYGERLERATAGPGERRNVEVPSG